MNEERGAALTVKNLELRYLTSCRTGPVPNVLEFSTTRLLPSLKIRDISDFSAIDTNEEELNK